MIEREREAETQAEGEAGSMLEPDAGLNPGTPGSHPGPKAGKKPLSHPRIPMPTVFNTELASHSFPFLPVVDTVAKVISFQNDMSDHGVPLFQIVQ